MLEKIPENQEARDAVAREVASSRRAEREGSMSKNRGGYDYVRNFDGLQAMFDYVKTLPSQTVLDIGAGTGRAAHELAESPLGEGLQFEATALRNAPEMKRAENVAKIHLTPAEVLRGIPDNSVGGILAFYSIAYSAVPEATVKRMDEVLVEGGVIKAIFGKMSTHQFEGLNLKTHQQFREAFERLGYDTATATQIFNVLMAVKKGGSVSAKELLENDARTYVEQLKEVPEPTDYID